MPETFCYFRTLIILQLMACLGCSPDRSKTLAEMLRDKDSIVYSSKDLSGFTRGNLTLPVPPQKDIKDNEIGGVEIQKGSVIDRDFAKQLSLAINLRLLILEECKICDDFFKIIDTRKLEFLFVSGSNFSDVHCKGLTNAPNLKLVVVEKCKTSRHGISLLENTPGHPEVSTWFTD